MRIFFDTEFFEDGKTIEPISIGMVNEKGDTYYAEFAETDLYRAKQDQWMIDNVLVHLTGETKPKEQIKQEILQFVGDKPEFWAYYADYDWVLMCQLFGRMIDLPKDWPKFCNDLKQIVNLICNPKLPKMKGNAHHALADAIWVKEQWERIWPQILTTKFNGGITHASRRDR